MIDELQPDAGAPCYYGVYPAIVTSLVKDTEKLGRIEVRFPFLGKAGEAVRALATLATPYADNNQGFEMLPAVDSQVIVAFEAGNLRRPYILGATWNGKEKLPVQPTAANERRCIRTRSGSVLEFFDRAGGAPKITLTTAHGLTLELDERGPTVTLKSNNGSFLKFESSGDVTLAAAARLNIRASAVTVNAPASNFKGSVTCLAHTATSITSPLYSQGAGNIW
jgi:uncharacterized protein involved in type VI secretion and phage assembly